MKPLYEHKYINKKYLTIKYYTVFNIINLHHIYESLYDYEYIYV